MTLPAGALFGRKIMVVEDNYLVAEHVRDILVRRGCDVVGPAGHVSRALELINRTAILHGALLDINLGEEFCFPVAFTLLERAVPFVFLTGYDTRSIIPAPLASAPVLSRAETRGDGCREVPAQRRLNAGGAGRFRSSPNSFENWRIPYPASLIPGWRTACYPREIR